MLAAVTSKWWVFVVRGIAAILFGVLAYVWPGMTIVALAILFGAYAFVEGVLCVAAAFAPFAGSRWWALLLEGILGLVVAFFVFTQPLISAAALVYTFGFWAIFTGIMEIVAGVQLRDVLGNEWLYVLGGIASIVFGVLIFRNPEAGAVAMAWLIGFYAVLFGLMGVVLGIRLQKLNQSAVTGARTT